MISEIRIQNFKSIRDLAFRPGRVTVLIGENGSGKSNILEAIAFAAGASANKLDNEFLANRGIRVAEDTWMRSAFPVSAVEKKEKKGKDGDFIRFSVKGTGPEPIFECRVHAEKRKDDGSFDKWSVTAPVWKKEVDEALKEESFDEEISQAVEELKAKLQDKAPKQTGVLFTEEPKKNLAVGLRTMLAIAKLRAAKRAELGAHASVLGLADFMIYAPENTTLRNPPPESAIQPLGTKGEGLFKLLQSFTDPKFSDRLLAMNESLRLFDWFEEFSAPDESATVQARLQIRDRWLASDRALFDQRSANEGFLYLLFYFALLMSWRTPRFFALDNVDNALNPKLCSTLMKRIVEFAKKYDKQVVCTTHNPAILDGLNLNEDDQRVYTVRRDSEGQTKVRRVQAPKPQPGEIPVRLSEAFMRGLIGGLPENF